MLDPNFSEDDWRAGLGSVDQVRASIDQIDAALLELLERRMHCSVAMGQAKRRANPDGNDIVFRPGREASILARMVVARPGLPTDLVYRIWRQIFSASCQVQQVFRIGYVGIETQAPALLHFGAMGSFHGFDQATAALEALSPSDSGEPSLDMAVLPFGDGQDWWRDLPRRGLYISATVPTLLAEGASPKAVVVTRHACDPVENGAEPGLRVWTLASRDGQTLEQQAGYRARGDGDAEAGHVIGHLALVALGLAG